MIKNCEMTDNSSEFWTESRVDSEYLLPEKTVVGVDSSISNFSFARFSILKKSMNILLHCDRPKRRGDTDPDWENFRL